MRATNTEVPGGLTLNRLSLVGKRAGYAAAGAVLVVGSTVGLTSHNTGSVTATDDDGLTITYPRQGYVGTTDNGLTYAPRPATEFRAQNCDLSSQTPDKTPAAGQLTVPSIGVEVPVGISANLSALPDAPQTVRFDQSAPLGAGSGKTVIAGHVDYAPEDGHSTGQLSPFGQLHTAGPCDHIYAADAQGQQREYVLTDMYTVPQEQIETTGIYTTEGNPALVLVTCSGPSVNDASGDDLFAYRYNLILEAIPAEVAA